MNRERESQDPSHPTRGGGGGEAEGGEVRAITLLELLTVMWYVQGSQGKKKSFSDNHWIIYMIHSDGVNNKMGWWDDGTTRDHRSLPLAVPWVSRVFSPLTVNGITPTSWPPSALQAHSTNNRGSEYVGIRHQAVRTIDHNYTTPHPPPHPRPLHTLTKHIRLSLICDTHTHKFLHEWCLNKTLQKLWRQHGGHGGHGVHVDLVSADWLKCAGTEGRLSWPLRQ